MKTYLVGGAVRDELLGYPFKEKDWVVVGATIDDMITAGYQQVGKDFPVFLHPKTKEEHALARTERKTAAGYKGFEVHASPEVTLEEDLIRRDLPSMPLPKMKQGHSSIRTMALPTSTIKFCVMYLMPLPKTPSASYASRVLWRVMHTWDLVLPATPWY